MPHDKSSIKEAVILAGGLGTRLRTAVADLPKCMAPVAGRPFLYYVIQHLRMQGIEKITFSLGYMHEVVQEWLARDFVHLDYNICIEKEPLGTGGAIQFALQYTDTENVLVTNGDTLFKADLNALAALHFKNHAACTLALKPMHDFDRYGVVNIDAAGIVTAFREKQSFTEGLINGGTYIINKQALLNRDLPGKFSFEKDYFEKFIGEKVFSGLPQHVYFIDIGIPEDFNRAQQELAAPALALDKIDDNWTLFLDRDGVINEDKPGGYILNADEFEFMPGAPALFATLGRKFKRIIIVTNQRGVGRGIMSEADLAGIHKKMTDAVNAAGASIAKIYYATDIDGKGFNRKPNPGMAMKAIHDFPDTDLSKSIMVGNNITDMLFGRNAGMRTVFLTTTNKNVAAPNRDIDLVFQSLLEFAEAL